MSIARTIPTHATARLFTTGNNVYETRQVNFKHEPDARVVQVASGYDHALILTGNQHGHTNIQESGKVHFVGNCDYMYTSEETTDWASPILLPKTADLKVLSLSCGYNHAVFLVENKDIVSVYGIGDDGMQQLNFQPNQGSEEQIDYSSANLYDPFKYDFLDREKVRKVRCGYYHSILITETGKVHYAGNISSGLHLDVLKDEFIVEACGGYEISVFITREGALYVGYLSQEGILGNSQLKKWDIDDHFIAASAGYYHAVFLTKSGDVYTCGQDSYGKLGRGATPTDGHQPMGKINTISNVRTISAGGYHTIMSTRDGLAYGCGHASFGQLGNDFHVEQNEPRLLDNKIDKGAYIIEIDACGWGSFYIENSAKEYGTLYFSMIHKKMYNQANGQNPFVDLVLKQAV